MEILVLFIIILLLILLYVNKSKEDFSNITKSKPPSKKYVLTSITHALNNNSVCSSSTQENNLNMPLYFATFTPQPGESNQNIIYTRSLNSGEWFGPITNSCPDNETIMTKILFGNDLGIQILGLGYNINKEYNLYYKENNDMCSKWSLLEQPKDDCYGKIIDILFDKDGLLMCLNGENGLIYKKKSKDLQSECIGPIKIDKPILSMSFYKDGTLMGIGRNGNIYKKDSLNWQKSNFSKYYNTNKYNITDLLLLTDGCMIGCAPEGIYKQTTPTFLSEFYNIENTIDIEKDNILTFHDVLLWKNGIPGLAPSINIDDSDIGKKYSSLIKFKHNMINMCKKRKNNYINLNSQTEKIGEQIQTQNLLMKNIDNKIQLLNTSLNK